jgi:cell division protein YceG involved in septum cleavage
MKKQFLILALCLTLGFTVNAQDAYVAAMQKEMTQMKTAVSAQDLQKVANGFARIAEMAQGEWLPDYYAALALVNAGFRTQGGLEEKDAIYAQAKKHADKAAKTSANNSEITALQGYIIMAELAADPNSRGQQLMGQAMQTFGKAIDQNRQNPRAIILMAQMEYGAAQFFGQGPEKACGLVTASLGLFEKEASLNNGPTLNPTWGKDLALQLKSNCN